MLDWSYWCTCYLYVKYVLWVAATQTYAQFTMKDIFLRICIDRNVILSKYSGLVLFIYILVIFISFQ